MPTLPDRRAFMAYCGSLGLGSTLLPGVLWGKVAAGAEITKETIAAAEEIAGVSFTDDERAVSLDERDMAHADARHIGDRTGHETQVGPGEPRDDRALEQVGAELGEDAALRGRAELVARAADALQEGGDWIWQLRRFERDLLAARPSA